MVTRDSETGERIGAPGSALGGLAERRKRLAARGEPLVLMVRGWDDDGGAPICVRYRKVPPEVYGRTVGAMAGLGRRKQIGLAEAQRDWLVASCDGVLTEVDGEKVSIDPSDPHGDPPRFDRRLRELLGESESGTARDAVRALFEPLPGEIFRHGNEAATWMGYAGADDDDADPTQRPG